jgi:hypothetical protein
MGDILVSSPLPVFLLTTLVFLSRFCFVKMNLMLIAIEYKPLLQSGFWYL